MITHYSKKHHFDFKEGQVILVNTKKGFIANTIKWFTKCKYNHVAIITEYLGELFITEAVAKGFVPTMSLEAYLKEIEEKKDKEILILEPYAFYTQHIQVTYNRLKQVANKGYEFLNLTLFQIIKQLTGKWIGTKDSKRVICSEAVAYAFPMIFPEPWKVDPQDFFVSPRFIHLKTIA